MDILIGWILLTLPVSFTGAMLLPTFLHEEGSNNDNGLVKNIGLVLTLLSWWGLYFFIK